MALAVAPGGRGSTPLHVRIANNSHPDRSGDLYVVQEPYWFQYERGPVAAMHGSPWNYDTHVPIIFAGHTIEPRMVSRAVSPNDVAATLAAYLGMTAPAASSGQPLRDVLP